MSNPPSPPFRKGGVSPLARRVYRSEYFWLGVLVAAMLAAHFAIIASPPKPIGDEVYYIDDARLILHGPSIQRIEHPPLGKLFIAAGMLIFGDNPVGWRFFSVIFGVTGILLFYLICRRLDLARRASFLATFVLATENLTFVQSSIAMLDVFSLTFALGAFLFYLKGRYILAGVSGALSALAKLYGALALVAIGLHWLFTKRGRSLQFAALVLAAPLAFVLLMIPMDYVSLRSFVDPISRIRTMMGMSASLTFASTSVDTASRPWWWVLRPDFLAYSYDPHYYATVSFTVWALIIPAVAYMAYLAVKRNESGLFGLAWFAGAYLVWIPISLVTDRISWIFYFYPAVGSVCLGIGIGLSRLLDLWKEKGRLRWLAVAALVFLLLHVAAFVTMTPVFLRGWPPWWILGQRLAGG